MPKYVEFTEDEAWAIDHTIRHTYSEGATNIGKDLLIKVMHVILEFEERRDRPLAPEVLPVALTEDECWTVDHQIRCDLAVNNKPVGRAVLLKVFRALTEYSNERDSQSGVEHLGALADLLRPPAEEHITDNPERKDTPPPSAGDSHKGPGHGPSDRQPDADDGTAGSVGRDK